MSMDPARKRRIRLTVALTAALVLAGGLVYTSFSAGSPAKTPSELLQSAQAGQSYKVVGIVVDGSVKQDGDALLFKVRDRDGKASIPIRYTGSVPDPFREGREVRVNVSRASGDTTFTGEKDSLITKCPSKFVAEDGSKPAGTY
jgi:cytochrome c-type biogenesis protein CcmE